MTRTRRQFWLSTFLTVTLSYSTSNGEEPNPTSFQRVDVNVGVRTKAILAAFRNGGDRVDLLVVGGNRLIRLEGREAGRYEIAASIPAGENPVDLALGDLDEDGSPDLALANHDTDYVTLLFGAPDGDFEIRTSSRFKVGVSPHPHAVRLSDIDSDGHIDLLVDDRDSEAIRVFPGLGNGEFGESRRIAVGGDPYRGMAIVDVTGDGDLDVLTPNPHVVSIRVGDGRGGFTRGAQLRPGFDPFSVVAADFNRDGLTDVAAGSGERAGIVAVWFGDDGGGYRAGDHIEVADGPIMLNAADLTGDGRAECLVTSYAGGGAAVLVGGEELTPIRMNLVGNPYGVTTGDFDGDGHVDFAVANDGVEYISLFLSRGS